MKVLECVFTLDDRLWLHNVGIAVPPEFRHINTCGEIDLGGPGYPCMNEVQHIGDHCRPARRREADEQNRRERLGSPVCSVCNVWAPTT